MAEISKDGRNAVVSRRDGRIVISLGNGITEYARDAQHAKHIISFWSARPGHGRMGITGAKWVGIDAPMN
jgi:hypothetical protein